MKTRTTILGLILIAGACLCVSLYASPPPMSGGGGTGDMTKAVYDANSNNVVDTATALAANGANCSAGQAPLGVDASGAVEGCWTPGSDGNDTEITRLASAEKANAATPVAGTTGVFSSTVTALSYLSTAPDGNHSVQAYNTTANPTCGSNPDMKGALASVGSTPVAQLCNGTDWVSLLTSGGALGTPASGTLTNCTGLPVAGIAGSTSTALGVGSIELGHATDTTVARSAAGAITVENNQVVLLGSTTITKYQYLPAAWMEDAAASPCAAAALISGEETKARLCDDNESVIIGWQVDPDWTAGFKYRVYYGVVANAEANDTVTWRLSGCSVGNSEALTCTAGAEISVSDELTTDDDANELEITDWSEAVTITGIAVGEWARLTLKRGADDEATEVNLIGIEIKYQAQLGNAY